MYVVLVAKPIIRHTTANELWDHWCLRVVVVVQMGGRCGPNGWSLFKGPWSKRVVRRYTRRAAVRVDTGWETWLIHTGWETCLIHTGWDTWLIHTGWDPSLIHI